MANRNTHNHTNIQRESEHNIGLHHMTSLMMIRSDVENILLRQKENSDTFLPEY